MFKGCQGKYLKTSVRPHIATKRNFIGMGKSNEKISIRDEDKGYLSSPNEYALVKEIRDGTSYYSIFHIVDNKLMMVLCDDFEYAIALGREMRDHGVAVFNDTNEIKERMKK